MKNLLKAKHWQIFMLTIGLPLILEIILIPFIIIGNNPMVILKIMPIMFIFFVGGLFGWLWAIAIHLQEKLPADLKLKVNRFKTFLLIPLIYFMIFFVILDSIMSGAIENGTGPNPAIFALIVPFHLFAIFCIFYCSYFVSRIFKTVELQRKVTFSDFAGEFYMILFFPVGIWIFNTSVNFKRQFCHNPIVL